MERDSFIFYRSYANALRQLSDKQFAVVMKSIFDYALDGELPTMGVVESVIFELIRPQIDANNKRYENGKKGAEFGVKGGRPKNPTETPNKPQDNPTETPNKPQDNPTERVKEGQVNPSETPNVNVNEKEKEYLRTQKEKSDEGEETSPLSAEESGLAEREGKKRKGFLPPTLAQIQAYAEERGREDLAKKFYDYFEAGEWHDSEGKPVKAWKQKFITWETHQPYADTIPRPGGGRPSKTVL